MRLAAASTLFFASAAGFANESFTYAAMPGQTLSREATWRVATWSGECVLKREPQLRGGDSPFALLTPLSGACPVGSTVDLDRGRAVAWKPYPADAPAGTVHVFQGIESSLLHDPLCNSNDDALKNRGLLDAAFAALRPGDTLSIPGKHCVAGGVVAERLEHVKIDLTGELFFSQGPKEWEADRGISFYGATNLTITSSNRKGLIHAKGCTHWYVQRTILGKASGKDLFVFDKDRNLTFGNSQVLIEHLRVHDSPGFHMYLRKMVGVTVRHMDVRVTCLPGEGFLPTALKMLAQQTDGIDIWGKDVHVYDVNIDNGDDCICVKGDEDGSGVISENWLVENSTARGEGLTIGTLGWGHNMPVRNVTFRNIHMPGTSIGIYVKPPYNNVTDVLYQNITIEGSALQFPVFIGPVHQFEGNCPWHWPIPLPGKGSGTCSTDSGAFVTNITIDGLKIIRRIQGLGRITGSADFLVMGNDKMKVHVDVSNVEVVGVEPKRCEDPPLSISGSCGNACYAAEVVTDGSVEVECMKFGTKVSDGACAPVMGPVNERCPSGVAHMDTHCTSGLRCNSSALMV